MLDVAIPAVMAGASAVMFEAGTIWPTQSEFLFWAAAAVLLISLVIQIIRGVRANRLIATTDSEIADFRLAMKDSIAPMARLLAEMPQLTPTLKRQQAKRVADKATAAAAHILLKHIPKVRANVFVLNGAATVLAHESTGGAGDDPKDFDTSTQAGKIAIAWAKAGGPPLVVADTENERRPGISKTSRYRSFVSVVIRSGPYSYGMLTIDSPEPDAFTEGSTEVETAKVLAELLAVGYAI
ncbi:hypothetical protein C3E77_15185 (plasmid) [Mycetocola zhujimingii]|nr:hypothetical protein C3E77_15185 [Mycetocola zhujimingii]